MRSKNIATNFCNIIGNIFTSCSNCWTCSIAGSRLRLSETGVAGGEVSLSSSLSSRLEFSIDPLNSMLLSAIGEKDFQSMV